MCGKVLIIFFIISLTGCMAQIQVPTIKPVVTNETELVDRVLAIVKKSIKDLKLDPITFPDMKFEVPGQNQSVALTNGTIKGLSNIERVGDVYTNTSGTLFPPTAVTRFRSAFAIYNVSQDQDIALQTRNNSYPNGHYHKDCDNITVYQVYKYDWLTQTATLDEFELSIGECNFNVTGLGERAESNSATINNIFQATKGPLLEGFNFTFKILINLALQAAKSALLAG